MVQFFSLSPMVLERAKQIFDQAYELKYYDLDQESAVLKSMITILNIERLRNSTRESSQPFCSTEQQYLSLQEHGITDDAKANDYLNAYEQKLLQWQPVFEQFEKTKQKELEQIKRKFKNLL